ncbi:MAG: hypothetical protein R3B70_16375 [Polyangiaceae bacterium]
MLPRDWPLILLATTLSGCLPDPNVEYVPDTGGSGGAVSTGGVAGAGGSTGGTSSGGAGGAGGTGGVIPTVTLGDVVELGLAPTAPPPGELLVSIGASGAVYMGASYTGTPIVGGVPVLPANNPQMYFIAHSATGQVLWGPHVVAASNVQTLLGLSVDSDETLLCLSGSTVGPYSLTFGVTNQQTTKHNLSPFGGGLDGFVAGLAPDTGAGLFAAAVGNMNGSQSCLGAGAFAGGCVVAGDFVGKLFYQDAAATPALLQPEAVGDTFVLRVTPQGEHVGAVGSSSDPAAVDMAPVSSELPLALASTGNGAHAVVGVFSNGKMGFGGQPVLDNPSPLNDLFVARFNANGALQYQKGFGAPDVADGLAPAKIALNNDGTVALSGIASAPIGFGGAELPTGPILAVLNFDGTHRFSMPLPEGVVPVAIAFSPSTDTLAMIGNFTGAPDFGHGPLTGYGMQDVFAAKWSSVTGELVWSFSVGGAGDDTALAMNLAAGGVPVVLATFAAPTSVGGTAYDAGSMLRFKLIE